MIASFGALTQQAGQTAEVASLCYHHRLVVQMQLELRKLVEDENYHNNNHQ